MFPYCWSVVQIPTSAFQIDRLIEKMFNIVHLGGEGGCDNLVYLSALTILRSRVHIYQAHHLRFFHL